MSRFAVILFSAVVLACSGGVQATGIETVTVGNPGNAGELSGAGAGGFGPDRICGAVDYVYRIGKFEVTAGQYTEFLNAVASYDPAHPNHESHADPHKLYNIEMWSSEYGCKIQRAGSGTESDPYQYTLVGGWADRPVNFVSWADTARYANWLHNGQPTGAQDLSTTEDGTYFLDGAWIDAEPLAITREPDATWVIPSEDEWYKAAYYDGGSGAYYDYPTSSDSAPASEACPGGDNSANYYYGKEWAVRSPYFRNRVGCYVGSASPYGTFDQGGNVWEWNEAVIDVSFRGLRGGSFYFGGDAILRAAYRSYPSPPHSYDNIGFRLATFADCNGNGVPDECDLDCGATIGMTGGSCSVVYPGCGGSVDEDGNEIPDECAPNIPAVSTWGLGVLALFVLTVGSVMIARRQRLAA